MAHGALAMRARAGVSVQVTQQIDRLNKGDSSCTRGAIDHVDPLARHYVTFAGAVAAGGPAAAVAAAAAAAASPLMRSFAMTCRPSGRTGCSAATATSAAAVVTCRETCRLRRRAGPTCRCGGAWLGALGLRAHIDGETWDTAVRLLSMHRLKHSLNACLRAHAGDAVRPHASVH